MTKLVGLLAAKEFGKFDKSWAKSIYQNLTPKILGVYRPEEHIDNPKGLSDSSFIDPDFVREPTKEQLGINSKTNMKNYIASPTSGQSFLTSLQYMNQEFTKAMSLGRNDEGLRMFGQGLHAVSYTHLRAHETSLHLVSPRDLSTSRMPSSA